MLTPAQLDAYSNDGFVLGSRFLAADDVAELRDEITRVIADRDRRDTPQPILCRNLSGDPGTEVWQIVNIWQASDAFHRLLTHPTLVGELGQLALTHAPDATEIRVWHDQIQYKPAHTGGANWWHQDSVYWPPIQPKDQQFTAWIALDDVDPDNGCMSMVPGSHAWGDQIEYLHAQQKALGNRRFNDLPRTFEGRPTQPRPCPVSAGQVHYHHALTWHGSPANASGRPRRAIAIHVMTDRTTLAPQGDHPMRPFIRSGVGQTIAGEAFPVLWSRPRQPALA